jgi:hypothetical protein
MPLQVKSLAEWEREGVPDMLSVVIPAHNEEGHISGTVEAIIQTVSDVLCETPIKRGDLALVGGSKCLQCGTAFFRDRPGTRRRQIGPVARTGF